MHPDVHRVTQDIAARSRVLREEYRRDIDAMASQPVNRSQLSCGNLAHGLASCATDDKSVIKLMGSANVGIVTAYNDMLSAHAPYADYPEQISVLCGNWLHRAGSGWCTRDVRWCYAGPTGNGAQLVQPRCDRAGHGGVSFSSHVRRGADAGHLRQDRARTIDGRAPIWAPAHFVRAGRANDIGPVE